MSAFVAITFENEDSATKGAGCHPVAGEGRPDRPRGHGRRDEGRDGKIHVKNEMGSGTESGALVGAILGSLLWVVFPVGAIVGGAIAGGLIGRAVKPGIDGGFVKESRRSCPLAARPSSC
jgi:hypothetical protein